MPVECPPCQWPRLLEERGPIEDPSILLTGTARIGDTAFQIVAIRIEPTLRWTPDYKSGVAEGSYQAKNLDSVLETFLEDCEYVASEFEELLGESASSVVELAPGPYRVWMMPASFRALTSGAVSP